LYPPDLLLVFNPLSVGILLEGSILATPIELRRSTSDELELVDFGGVIFKPVEEADDVELETDDVELLPPLVFVILELSLLGIDDP
tara:strand:- start:467 stop:724 length:258 start_codon:yes stop_codon:yes gene_type:complete